MSTAKNNVLEYLAEPENSFRLQVLLSSVTFSEAQVDGQAVQIMKVLAASDIVIPRYGAIDPDGNWIGNYNQKMVLDSAANVDDTNLVNGINLINNHRNDDIKDTFGITLPGTAGWSVDGGKLYLNIMLSAIAEASNVAACIKQRTIKFVSIGALILKYEWDMTGDVPLRTCTLVSPYEISLVNTPAIAEAMILSADPKAQREFIVTKSASAPAKPGVTEQTAEQIAAAAAAQVAPPAKVEATTITVLSATDANVAKLLKAGEILGPSVLAAVEAGRVAGFTADELHVELNRAAKARVAQVIVANRETSIVSDLPLPAQTKEVTKQKFNFGEVLKARKEMRSGRRA